MNHDQSDPRNPERELLYEQALTSGAIIRVYSETFDVDAPPTLRIEKVQPGRERQPLNFGISARFADAFVESVGKWRDRIEAHKRRIARQAPLDQRSNLKAGR